MLEVVVPRSHNVLGPLVEVRSIGWSELEELTLESFEILRKQNADPFDAIPYTVESLFGNLFLSRWMQPFRRVSFLIYKIERRPRAGCTNLPRSVKKR
jgi:hypothetical protein